jgi:hypothetical protein
MAPPTTTKTTLPAELPAPGVGMAGWGVPGLDGSDYLSDALVLVYHRGVSLDTACEIAAHVYNLAAWGEQYAALASQGVQVVLR